MPREKKSSTMRPACQLSADKKTIKDNVVDEIFNIFEDFLRGAIQYLLQVRLKKA